MPAPTNPKIYHIAHVDNLTSIIADGCLWPDSVMAKRQGPIVHLEADLRRVVAWAEANGHRWAFSPSNAGAYYAQFHTGLDHLDEIKWAAVAATDFRKSDVKEGKQAEFLLEKSLPWSLVERIGVHTRGIAQTVAKAVHGAVHRPTVEIRRDWYY